MTNRITPHGSDRGYGSGRLCGASHDHGHEKGTSAKKRVGDNYLLSGQFENDEFLQELAKFISVAPMKHIECGSSII